MRWIEASSGEDKSNLFSSFDPLKQTWVVSDLQSKWALQRRLIEQNGSLPESAIVRASELWRKVFYRAHPTMRVISQDLAASLIWTWLEPLELKWVQTPSSSVKALQYLSFMMPILVQPGHDGLMDEWFEQHPESVLKWRHWYELSKILFEKFRQEELILAEWIPAWLLQSDADLNDLWPRDLVFDLGVRLTPCEAQLVQTIDAATAVTILVPKPNWDAWFKKTMRGYELLGHKTAEKRAPLTFDPHFRFTRYSTHLAQVKAAVASVRRWLDEGIAPDHIAVVSTQIEEFWPVLNPYFETEGVPVQKSTVSRLQGFPDFLKWASRVRLRLQKVASKDLEVLLYQDEDRPTLDFAEFRKLFATIYSPEDLARAPQVFGDVEYAEDAAWTFFEFMSWSLPFWPKSNRLDRLEGLLSKLSQDVSSEIRMRPAAWLNYIEGRVAKMEIDGGEPASDGIHCVSLSSAEWLPVTHVCFLNASEEALGQKPLSPFSDVEAGQLLRDLGMPVQSYEAPAFEFEYCWLLQRGLEQANVFFAATDFMGEELTPSKFWLLKSFSDGTWNRMESPPPCRWDEIQKAAPEAAYPEARSALLQDAGVEPPPLFSNTVASFSASVIEDYLECPFVFAARKVFRLVDEPSLDLDMDRMSRGRLLHGLFCHLLKEPVVFERSAEDLGALVEQVREEEGLLIGDDRIWPMIKNYYVGLAERFLLAEQQWRARFPKTQTAAAELPFEVSFSLKQKKFETKDPSTGPLFRGRIDRIDGDGDGRYVVIDYKSSKGKLRGWRSWLSNHQLQLLLYADIVESGLTELPAGRVEAAVYYLGTIFERHQGFQVRDAAETLFEVPKRHHNRIEPEELETLRLEFRDVVADVVRKVQEGRFEPRPNDIKNCENCSWRRLCRAPHLN